MAIIDRKVSIHTTPSALWKRLTDHESMTDWLQADSVELTKEGDSEAGGVGARRVVRAAGFALVEDILHLAEPWEMDYQLVGGVPGLKSHLGQLRIKQEEESVSLSWHIELHFKVLYPTWFIGPLLVRKLAAGLDGSLGALKALLEADAG